MENKIWLSGEYTKEELQEELKKLNDKPTYEIKSNPVGDLISLYKNGEIECSLLAMHGGYDDYNVFTISIRLAAALDDLMESRQIVDKDVWGHCVYFNLYDDEWITQKNSGNTTAKHFKTLETAEFAAKLLNESKDIRENIDLMDV